jgi:hypothetical protein
MRAIPNSSAGSGDFNRMIGFNTNVYKGRYFHSGSGFMSDALTQVLPLLKTYGRAKFRRFAGNVVNELDDQYGVRDSLKRASIKTARSVFRDLTGRSPQGATRKKTKKKPKKAPRKKVVKKKRKVVPADFFDND